MKLVERSNSRDAEHAARAYRASPSNAAKLADALAYLRTRQRDGRPLYVIDADWNEYPHRVEVRRGR